METGFYNGERVYVWKGINMFSNQKIIDKVGRDAMWNCCQIIKHNDLVRFFNGLFKRIEKSVKLDHRDLNAMYGLADMATDGYAVNAPISYELIDKSEFAFDNELSDKKIYSKLNLKKSKKRERPVLVSDQGKTYNNIISDEFESFMRNK